MNNDIVLSQGSIETYGQTAQLPKEIISKIVAITSRGSDATVRRKKDGYKVYETKLVEQ